MTSVQYCAGLVGTAYTAIFIIASAANTGLQGKAFYLGPKSLQNYFLGTNVRALLEPKQSTGLSYRSACTLWLLLCKAPDAEVRKPSDVLCRLLRMHGAGIP